MKGIVCLCVVAALANVAIAQDSPAGVTYGEFARLVVDIVSTTDDPLPTEQGALDLLKGYDFLPLAWQVDGVLTQADLAGVLVPAGGVYTAADPQAPMTSGELIAILQSQREALIEYFEALGHEYCTHGDFAIILVRTISPPADALPDAQTALDLLKREGLIPLGWLAPEYLTHGEMAEVLGRFGLIYETVTPDDPISLPFVITYIRREISLVKDYWAKRTGHGFSLSHVLDLGVDRAVSPSYFYYRAHVHRRP
jgi:hypothetical protein